ncbi:MAG TPA: hypothetical protein DCM86_01745 [Verrucomicrobiales bacterium]|nr:hypothetical protein [Verrucomicrobiales bacterium]
MGILLCTPMLSQWKAAGVCHGFLLGVVLAQGTLCTPLLGQTNQTRLASEARFDLYATTNVLALQQVEILGGLGTLGRLPWMKPADQPRALSALFPITHFTSNELVVRFTPVEAGRVTLSLLGPYERIPTEKEAIYQADVLWDLIDVAGGQLVPESAALLRLPVRSWFRQRYDVGISVQARQPVTLRLVAHAAVPAGYEEPKPLSEPDPVATKLLQRFQHGVSLAYGNDLVRGGVGSDEDFAGIRREGFDHVRLSVAWQLQMGAGPEYPIHPELLARVEEILGRAARQELGVILGCQDYDGLYQNPGGELPRFLALWKQLEARFGGGAGPLAFELITPSSNRGSTPLLNPVYAATLKAIRGMSPQRLVWVSPGRLGSVSELSRLRLPEGDPFLVVSLHSREPELFTQQLAGGPGRPSGIRFPGPPDAPVSADSLAPLDLNLRDWMARYQAAPADRNPSGPSGIRGLARFAKEWSRRYGRPVYFSDWGCNRQIEASSRARYYGAWREALEREGLAWGIADWKQSNRYWDDSAGQPMVGLHEALFPGRPPVPPAVAAPAESSEPFRNAIKELRDLQKQIATDGRKSTEELAVLRQRAAEMQEEARRSRQGSRWVSGGLIVLAMGLLGLGLFVIRRRPQSLALEPLDLAAPVDAATGGAVAVRQGTMAHLARLMMDKLVMRLLSDRRETDKLQTQAARELAEMEQRLEQLRAPIQDRMRAYEKRIADLEEDLARKGEENRELIRTKIALTRERLASAQASGPVDEWKPSPMENFGVRE